MNKLYMKKTLFFLLLLVAGRVGEAQVPVMSSYPSASAVIFLDFDGHTVDGTGWNYNGPIYCAPSGLDNTKITSIFNRVAEDYRPFNVNVTTDSTKFLAAPINKRIRVILTITSSWYGNAGGVAFVGSFNWGDDTPCFVFSALLAYNEKYIAEATTHEAGHTLGLYHQSAYNSSCVKTSEYNGGTGTGEIAWAPIMGVGYYKNMTLWHNGPSSYGCTNLQNDLAIITSNNGFGLRTDDYPNSLSQATQIPFTNSLFVMNGVVEKSDDVDYIRFTLPVTSRFQLDAIPYNVGTGHAGSNVDLQVTLYDNQMNLVRSYNPGTLLNSVIDTNLSNNTWYLMVEGKGNNYAPDYASLGSYSLSGRYTPGNTLPLRQLLLKGVVKGDRHQFNWLIDADETVTEQVLEVSLDGRTFTAVSGAPVDSRDYQYKPLSQGVLRYRMKVSFDDGKTHYSNLVALRNESNQDQPRLLGTLLTGDVIAVNSPGLFDYVVYDINGKMLLRGQLRSGLNNLPAANLGSGMYMIRFTQGGNQWTEKLIRP
jgi:hypothetical protein